jgi:ribosomal protein S12 methylthiotransferase
MARPSVDFTTLLDFLIEAKLARVGCFKYEDVDGAPANALPYQVSEEVKGERWFCTEPEAMNQSRWDRSKSPSPVI